MKYLRSFNEGATKLGNLESFVNDVREIFQEPYVTTLCRDYISLEVWYEPLSDQKTVDIFNRFVDRDASLFSKKLRNFGCTRISSKLEPVRIPNFDHPNFKFIIGEF